MASNIRDAFKNLSGRDITDPEIQRIMAAAQALGVRNDDPTIMLLMILEHNQGIVNAAPERIKKILKDAEQSANNVATATMESATAKLIPDIKDAVTGAARQAITKVQLGASMITLWFGVLALGGAFILGMLWGSKILYLINAKLITQSQFWEHIGVYTFFALVTPILLVFTSEAFDNESWFSWLSATAAGITIIVFLVMLGLISYHSFMAL
jgi:hypothetical protein